MRNGLPVVLELRDALVERLEGRTGARFTVVVTRNRVRLVSVRRLGGVTEVRVSTRVLDEGAEALDAVVAFVLDGERGRAQMRELIARLPPPKARPRRAKSLRPVGRSHDLSALLAEESLAAFGEVTPVDVTWGRRHRMRRSQRTIRLGSYAPEDRVIRIHPLLDQPAVPAWFIGFVLFHELLHHRLGQGAAPEARYRHPPVFREAERRHARYEDARAWERDVLPGLMRRGLPW